MQALILDGRSGEDGRSVAVHDSLVRLLAEAGLEVESMALREMEIRHCVGCFGCWDHTPGECLIDDPARDVARAFIASDLVVLLTPVTFGGYSSDLKKALDRIICLVSPEFLRIDGEIHHKPRYASYPRLLAVGLQPTRDEDSATIFSDLLERNAINFHTPAHAAVVLDLAQPAESAERSLRSGLRALEVAGD